MKPFFETKKLQDVHALAREITPLGAESVALDDALGRTLAEDLKAPMDLPGFSRATMDGFAVVGAGTFGASETSPAYLELVGEVIMGRAPEMKVKRTQCVRIGTGGMLPEGADAVMMVEHTRMADEHTVEISRSVAPGTHVLGPTDDAREGQVLLEKGQRLRPQDVGMLAAMGVTEPVVVVRPRVGVVSTGDEVVGVSAMPAVGQVRDVNTHTLCCQVRDAGAVPVVLGLVGDERGPLAEAVQRSLEHCDLTVLSGGSSVGMRDLTREVFLSFEGSELLVHGVAVSPGKPFMWVRRGSSNLLGLPGQVASCMIAFHLFVEPIIERLAGREPCSFTRFARVEAILTRNVAAAPGREVYQRVRVNQGESGREAEPLLGKSGLLRTLTEGHGLVRIPLGSEGLDAGSEVTVMLYS